MSSAEFTNQLLAEELEVANPFADYAGVNALKREKDREIKLYRKKIWH